MLCLSKPSNASNSPCSSYDYQVSSLYDNWPIFLTKIMRILLPPNYVINVQLLQIRWLDYHTVMVHLACWQAVCRRYKACLLSKIQNIPFSIHYCLALPTIKNSWNCDAVTNSPRYLSAVSFISRIINAEISNLRSLR